MVIILRIQSSIYFIYFYVAQKSGNATLPHYFQNKMQRKTLIPYIILYILLFCRRRRRVAKNKC